MKSVGVAAFSRVVHASGRRGVVYLVAAFTGLRRAEMKSLLWCDVDLDGATPCLRIRASTTKNKRRAILPLLPPLVVALRELREKRGNPSGKVFHYLVPMMARFRADLAAAGIPFQDELGRRVDFHALRKTFCTVLQRRGVTMRTAQELMRHCDPRQTGEVYTDATALPLLDELRKASASVPSLPASRKVGKRGQKLALDDQKPLAGSFPQRALESVLVLGCPSEKLEARAGIEPAVELLQSSALPLGDRAV